MNETSLDKIKKVVKHRNFTNFWEAVQYMLDAGYSEFEALKIGLELFNGDVWGNVISAYWSFPISSSVNSYLSVSGGTITSFRIPDSLYICGVDSATNDDLIVEVFSMTKEANLIYLPIYKSYIETRDYAEIKELEGHIKSFRFKLTTELAINFFKKGCEKLK